MYKLKRKELIYWRRMNKKDSGIITSFKYFLIPWGVMYLHKDIYHLVSEYFLIDIGYSYPLFFHNMIWNCKCQWDLFEKYSYTSILYNIFSKIKTVISMLFKFYLHSVWKFLRAFRCEQYAKQETIIVMKDICFHIGNEYCRLIRTAKL